MYTKNENGQVVIVSGNTTITLPVGHKPTWTEVEFRKVENGETFSTKNEGTKFYIKDDVFHAYPIKYDGMECVPFKIMRYFSFDQKVWVFGDAPEQQ